MLVFNQQNKYDVNNESDPSYNSSVQERTRFPSSGKAQGGKKKLTKTNIEFLKSLGFKIKSKQ